MLDVRSSLLLSLVIALGGCKGADRDTGGSREVVTDEHVRLPLEGGRDIMQAKLAHAHAILDALALEDWQQIALNADDLVALSEMSEWRVHTSAAYSAFSESFRGAVRKLASDARAEDANAIADDYAEVARACLGCHTYLRREGLFTDPPGRVSMRSGAPSRFVAAPARSREGDASSPAS